MFLSYLLISIFQFSKWLDFIIKKGKDVNFLPKNSFISLDLQPIVGLNFVYSTFPSLCGWPSPLMPIICRLLHTFSIHLFIVHSHFLLPYRLSFQTLSPSYQPPLSTNGPPSYSLCFNEPYNTCPE